MSDFYEYTLCVTPWREDIIEMLYKFNKNTISIVDEGGDCKSETTLPFVEIIARFSEIHPELFMVYSNLYAGGDDSLTYIQNGKMYVVESEFPSFEPENLDWIGKPEFKFNTYFAKKSKIPIIHVETDPSWDSEDGPRCRIYLNDEPIYENPALEDE